MGLRIEFGIITTILLCTLMPFHALSQQVANVQAAFAEVSAEPEVITIQNKLKVPRFRGHLQGAQVMEVNGQRHLVISGSSRKKAFLLHADLHSGKTERVVTLMQQPYRHAGGIQLSEPYLIVGIEDNFTKTSSRVCLYDYKDDKFQTSKTSLIITREGAPKEQTAGATGLLKLDTAYLAVVANWDSRQWDFLHLDLQNGRHRSLETFTVREDWPGYQSINLIKDAEAIYAIGFYKRNSIGCADLILVSQIDSLDLIMEKLQTRRFNQSDQVDFNAAAGLQVDSLGKLHIWATQREPTKQIVVNHFSQE